MHPGGTAIPSTLFCRIGRTRREIHLSLRPSEDHGVILPALEGAVNGIRKQPRS
jgi:hypothetical protein